MFSGEAYRIILLCLLYKLENDDLWLEILVL